MRSGLVSPTVAIPSVRNTTTPSPPSAGGSAKASVAPPRSGSAVGVEAADPLLGGAHVIRRHVRPTGGVTTYAASERDHPEPVTRAERAEQLHQRSLGLVELVA